jgi:hypothetical protein
MPLLCYIAYNVRRTSTPSLLLQLHFEGDRDEKSLPSNEFHWPTGTDVDGWHHMTRPPVWQQGFIVGRTA